MIRKIVRLVLPTIDQRDLSEEAVNLSNNNNNSNNNSSVDLQPSYPSHQCTEVSPTILSMAMHQIHPNVLFQM